MAATESFAEVLKRNREFSDTAISCRRRLLKDVLIELDRLRAGTGQIEDAIAERSASIDAAESVPFTDEEEERYSQVRSQTWKAMSDLEKKKGEIAHRIADKEREKRRVDSEINRFTNLNPLFKKKRGGIERSAFDGWEMKPESDNYGQW